MAAFKTHNFLPEIFRSDANQKFLNATLDQLTSEPNFKKVSGYIGRKFAPTFKSGDSYVLESTAARQHYQVEPAVVITTPGTDTPAFYAGYTDLINKIGYYGGNTADHSRLFANDVYSYSGKFDFDKFVNFSQYCWLPDGPESVIVSSAGVPLHQTWDVQLDAGTGEYKFNNGAVGNTELVLAYGGIYNFNLDGTTGPFWIQAAASQFGVDASRPNIDVRQVFGVENNGATTGVVTFKVPLQTTQNKYVEMPLVTSADYATSLAFSDVYGSTLEKLNAVFGGLDGIVGNIQGKSVIFINKEYVDDSFWAYDAIAVPAVDRNKSWTVRVVDGKITLVPNTTVALDQKVYVKSGNANATKQFYTNYYNQFEEVPLITAPASILYYQNGNTPAATGTIKLVQPVGQLLTPNLDIEGRAHYTSPNGVPFTNGLKVTFDASASDDFAHQSFYVSGVGKSIKLVPTADMIAVENWANSSVVDTHRGSGYKVHDLLTVTGGTYTATAMIQVTAVSSTGAITGIQVVDGGNYSVLPANPVSATGGNGDAAQFNLVLQPATPDYLTINRASIDLNAWSRSNRWFHSDVVKFAAEFNGSDFVLDQNFTAKRPIIEFHQNTKLFGHGTVASVPINILDTLITNAYTQIETVPAVNADVFVIAIAGQVLTLRNGDRVVFSNDESLVHRNKIYDFSIVDISDDSSSPTYIGRLVESADSAIVEGSVVIAKSNTTAGKEFWFDGVKWNLGQQKERTNQAPLFDAFDMNGISFGDATFYTNTQFLGTTIFSYKKGTGNNDTVLGFPLSYRSFNNVGDIQFDNTFDSDSFTYLIGPVNHTVPINSGVLHITSSATSFDIDNGWAITNEKTKQYQLISNIADGVNNMFETDILPEANVTIPNIKVLVNGKYLTTAQFGMVQVGVRYAVVVDDTLLAAGDSVDILIYSKNTSDLGFYQVPANLDNNAGNVNFATLTLGQLRNHLITLFNNSTDVVGAVPGNSNLRDLEVKLQGGSILKHSAPLIYSELFLIDEKMNFVDSIRLAQREYSKFKNKFLELASKIEVDVEDIPGAADAIIKTINSIKNSNFAWYYSDMVPQGDAKTVLPDYAILDPRVKTYELSTMFSDTKLSNRAVLIYLSRITNGQTAKILLAKDRDYTFSTTTPSFTIADSFNLNYDDIISVVEYSSTDGNFVPETPTKLGLYPKFVPSIYSDSTYLTTTNVIQGHDGSITPAFNDYRDDLLLELELRIYNNIKIDCKFNTIIDSTPGKFRKTDYSLDEYNQILTNSFLTWAGANRLDFTTNKYFDSNNAWTWNYKKFRDTIDGSFLPGSWRATFMWLYDTMRPHTHPWEMLGFTAKPTWWQDRYGPAPYTGGNLTLWTDLEQGLIYSGARAGIDSRYARPGLTKLIPVDDAGNLLSPEKYAVLDFDSAKANASFEVGNIGPVEAAWRKSSDYAYAVQLAMALSSPARYFGLNANVDRYEFNSKLAQYIVASNNQQIRPTTIEINGDDSADTVVRTAGYINWIAEYLKNLGIGNPQALIKAALKNTTVQLNYKVGGYTDKKFLKILAEQGSPSSTNASIVVPDENYRIILNKSVPVERIVYSAVIVEKSANGYTVSGYDLNNPYFTIVPSQANNNAYTVKSGKLTGTIYKDYQPVLVKIAYGYEFNSSQQVVDFLVSYQRALQSQGFVFIDTDPDLGEKKDWVLSAKEFLTWAQQGWTPGNLLVLSPIKDVIRVVTTDTVVDAITNSTHGSKLLDPNFTVIKTNNFSIVRSDNDFSVSSIGGQTIALAELSLVQYEHVIIFDNTTVFNDIIYSSDTGNRQYRLKFVGYKTADWTGAMNPPGFIYNSSTVAAWQSGQDYRKGTLVTFKDLYYAALDSVIASPEFDNTKWKQIDQAQIKSGLLPNLANSAKTFETFYDIDNQPYDETTNFYSNGLIGFRERSYLTDLLFEAETQSKFYQGYIKQKGTMNAVTALSAAQINNSINAINVYEEWALRVGEYGATDSNQYAEVILSDLVITANPAAIQMLPADGVAALGATAYYPLDIFKASRNNSPYMFDLYETSSSKLTLPVAGYPRLDDVDMTIFDLANYSTLSASMGDIGTGYTIWTAKDFDGKWNVYRVTETGISVTSLSYSMDNIANVTTSAAHSLRENDIIALKGFSVISGTNVATFDGFYRVYGIVDKSTFSIVLTTGAKVLQKAGVIYDNAILFHLVSSRLSTPTDIVAATPIYGWASNDNIWVDNASSDGWGVFQRAEPWKYRTTALLNESEYVGGDRFGSAIKSTRSRQFIYVGAPTSGDGRVASFVRMDTGIYVEDASWIQHSSYTNSSTGVKGFGEVIEINDRALIIGASKSNNSTGQVYIYSVRSGGIIEILQCITSDTGAVNFGFGASICTSADGNWLYIGEPGSNRVYAYEWLDRSLHYPLVTLVIGTTTYDIAATLNASEILVRGKDVYVPNRDYTVSGYTITFTAPLSEDVTIGYAANYVLVDTITGHDTISGDNFGVSLACDDSGQTLVVGANSAAVNGHNKSGAVYVFNRSIENFVARGNTNSFTPSRVISALSRVMLDGVDQIPGAEYLISGNSAQFVATIAAGSVVSIETNYFTQIDKLVGDSPSSAQRMGSAVEICANAASIYAGAPGYMDATYSNGLVYKFSNPAKLYSTISAPALTKVTTGHSIVINGVPVVFAATSLASVVNSINSSGIPGVVASIVGSTLTVSTTVHGVDVLSITPGQGTAFSDLGFKIYPQTQIIKHPRSIEYQSFGTVIKISADDQTLAITSYGAQTTEHITFDNNMTAFDSKSTVFSHAVPNSGAVYIYDLVTSPAASITAPSRFEFTQELQSTNLSSGFEFGAALDIIGTSVFVGVAASDILRTDGSIRLAGAGSVLEFNNINNTRGWNLVRSETPQIDYASISRAFIYNKNTKSIVSNLDIYDPAKGKVLGIADQDLDYKSESDPAMYNDGAASDNMAQGNFSASYHWGKVQLGRTWWDLSQVRFINYEQGSLDYKNKNWGATFPGSVFKVYEWVESEYLPSQYAANGGNGVPRDAIDNNSYVTYTYVDQATGVIKSKYYYWVSDKSSVDVNVTSRTNSVLTIQQILSNPKDQNIPYIAAIATNAVSLFNVSKHLTGSAIALHIDHTPVQNTNIIHTEYELVKENADAPIPLRIVNKLRDSLSGIDFAGHAVPDPALSVADRYGIDIRPRQTMFVDRFTALENFVKYVNTIFAKHPITNLRSLDKLSNGESRPAANTGAWDIIVDSKAELTYIDLPTLTDGFKVLVNTDTDNDGLWSIYQWAEGNNSWALVRIQSYSTGLYFNYVPWYDSTYDHTATPTYTISKYQDVARLQLFPGATINVTDNGDGRFAIYRVTNTLSLDQVGSENGTIQISPTLYDYRGFGNDNFDTQRFDQNPILETRDVFSAVVNDILIKELQVEFNKLFFSLVNYVHTEQQAPDWIFKTSFISVVHKIRDLAQYPSYIKDNQTYYEDYLNEVKPYRTIIREYLPTQSATDFLHAGATDFDLPSYYDTVSSTYRSPNGDYTTDAELLATDTNYADWYNNHSYKVVSISVASAGDNYTLEPAITISGGGGSGATAYATILYGKIKSVVVTNPGSGYMSAPTITISGNGNGAVLVPVLHSEYWPLTETSSGYNTIRSIDTSLKFDRVSYTSDVITWQANTAVQAATLGFTDRAYTTQSTWIAKSESGASLTLVGNTDKLHNAQFILPGTGASSSTYWLASGKLIAHNGSVYFPHSAVAGSTMFDASQFELISHGNVLLDTNNRIDAFYAPTVGMPGRPLAQSVNGIEYPGISVTGTTFADNMVLNSWETTDGIIILDDNGEQIEFASYLSTAIADPVDSTIVSYYADTLLGARPEDILIDGGEYVDAFSSHAPEEMIPGRVFETLDIQVLQANTAGFDTRVFTITNCPIQEIGYGYMDAKSRDAARALGVDVSGVTLINISINGIANAVLTPVLSDAGELLSIIINNGGSGLTSTSNPILTITGSNIAAAQATAILSQNTYDLIGWRDFYPMSGIVSYTRISNKFTTSLSHDLLVTDSIIGVIDGTILAAPSVDLSDPGRVVIDGEAITYWKNYAFEPIYAWHKNTHYAVGTVVSHLGNKYVTTGDTFAASFAEIAGNLVPGVNWLGQIRRAVDGTGAAAVHRAGLAVVDSGSRQVIPDTTFIPDIGTTGAPETFIGNSVRKVFATTGISSIYPENIKVQIDGKYVTNFKIIQLVPTVTIEILQIGANPFTVGFVPAAPIVGAEIIISALVEGLWENTLATGGGLIFMEGLPWVQLVEDIATPNLDPVSNTLFPNLGYMPSNNNLETAAPPVNAIVDGGGMMLANTIQARFIRNEF